jgi:polyisoprenoid-binding protein YceI
VVFGRHMRRGLIASGVALAILCALGIGLFVLLDSHHAPGPLALTSPTPVVSPGSLAGSWKVGSGSEVGYRVNEQFINQPGPTQAVARTSKVSGGVQISGTGPSLRATAIHFSADLSSLQSQDKYATYQLYQRDFFIRTVYLQTDQFPTAEFQADSVVIPATIESAPTSLTVSGRLTVHGVTKSVTANMQIQLTGDAVEVAGSVMVDMRDFGIEVPDISFTKAQPEVVIEYRLLFVRS